MSGELAGGLLPTGEYGHTLNNPMYDSGPRKKVSVHVLLEVNGFHLYVIDG